MNIEAFDLNLLRVFDAVYREQNMSRAAAALGLSQPGISQALNRLRKVTGDPLFIRQPHGVVPTAYSDALAGPIRHALEGLHNALNIQTSQDIRHTERKLRVSMSDYSESLILAPLTRILMENAPGLHLRVMPVDGIDLAEALQQGELDLALGALPVLNEHYRHQILFTEEFVCIARRGHPAIHDQLSLETYAQARHVGLAARSVQGSKIQQACLASGFERQTAVVVPNFLTIPFIVAATDCLGTIPRRLLRLIPAHLGLQVLAPPLPIPPANIRQYWSERQHHDVVHRWLREQIFLLCQTV